MTKICRYIDDPAVFYRQYRRYCQLRWADFGDDVLHETWIIAEKRGYFCFSMFKEAARNLGIYRWWHNEDGVVLLPPSGKSAVTKGAYARVEKKDDRIDTIIDTVFDSRVKLVINLVRAGSGIVEACAHAGIGYNEFRRKARQAYEQPALFKEVAA